MDSVRLISVTALFGGFIIMVNCWVITWIIVLMSQFLILFALLMLLNSVLISFTKFLADLQFMVFIYYLYFFIHVNQIYFYCLNILALN